MDTSEATKIVMSRIQSFDPENALKIMGYILIQEQGEKEMIRLAFSPDALLLSYMNQAKMALGLIRPENPFPQNSPRIMIPNNGFHLSSSPSSPSLPFPRTKPRPIPVLDRPNNSPALHFNDFGDEFFGGGGGAHYQAQDELPFLDDVADPIISPSANSDSLVFGYGGDWPHPLHRRSCSVNDAALLDEVSGGNGFLWRPCMYFARGFCKNGSTCKFLHGDFDGVEAAGSPNKAAGLDELFKLRAFQQQRFPFMNENHRNDNFSAMGLSSCGSSSARQIYLTFPADSTFKEEDVSNYFSMFGPVQDVRIPYQQKRMFGFVTFVYPETVKLILAKGNPHFVCDSRVLVKPYKEKGKVREKKHLERGEHSACLSPSGLDSRDHFDHPFVPPRLLLSSQEMMLRRKLENEAELQHTIELQGQRMMRLQLRDLENLNNNHHYQQTGIPCSSPRPSQLLVNHHPNIFSHSEESNEKLVPEGAESSSNNIIDSANQLHHTKADDSDSQERC